MPFSAASFFAKGLASMRPSLASGTAATGAGVGGAAGMGAGAAAAAAAVGVAADGG